MFRTAPRLLSLTSPLRQTQFNINANPYKARSTWPPDFSRLSERHKFRLEKRYRRRAKLKWARPRWTKGVKLAQWGSVLFVIVYGVFFLDWNVKEGDPPFKAARDWYKGLADTIWTKSSTEAAKTIRREEQAGSRSSTQS